MVSRWCTVGVLVCAIGCGGETENTAIDAPAADAPIDVFLPSGSDAALPGSAALVIVGSDGMAITQIDFSSTGLGATDTALVRATNTGGEPTLGFTISSSDAVDFEIDEAVTTCAASLMPGASCDIGMDFHPTSVGDHTATLAITSLSGASATVLLDGIGVIADLQASPSTVPLGDIDVGASGIGTLTIANIGSGPGAIGMPTISGTDWTLGATTCGTSLDANTSCTIDVAFTPTVLGASAASLDVTLAGAALSIPLSATGTSSLTIVVAGNGTGTVTSAPAGIVCGSTCTAHFAGAVELTAQTGSGSTFASWSLDTCGGSDCTLAASPSARTVTATFVAPTALYLEPTSLEFGTLTVGSNRRGDVVAINDNASAVPISVALSGSDYTLVDGCGSSLGPGSDCGWSVTFAPTGLGARPGSLDVVVNGAHHTSTFAGAGGSFFTVAVIGDPTSSVTTDAPTLAACTGVCGALVTGDVTLTAHAGSGAAFVGWSPGTCGTSTTCTVTGSTSPQTIRARFASGASTPPIHVEPSQDLGPLAVEGALFFGQSFTIFNDTNAVVPLDGFGVNGEGWSTGAGTCGTTLAAGGNCTAQGAFSPSNVGYGLGAHFQVTTGGVTYSTPLGAVAEFTLNGNAVGHGRVTGAFGLSCPGFCSEFILSAGDKLTATPDPGFAVQTWTLGFTAHDNSCNGSQTQCDVVPAGDNVSALVTFLPE